MCGVNRSKRKYFDCSRDVTSGCSPVATKCIAVNGEIGARALHSVRLVPYILFKRMQTDGAVFTRSNGIYRRCENIRCTGGEPTENAWSHLRCLWEHSNKGSRSLLSSPIYLCVARLKKHTQCPRNAPFSVGSLLVRRILAPRVPFERAKTAP